MCSNIFSSKGPSPWQLCNLDYDAIGNNIRNMWEYGKHIGATINCRFYNLKTLELIFQLPIHFD